MVFVLDDIEKIETDRMVGVYSVVDTSEYVQETDDVRDINIGVIADKMFDNYFKNASRYIWGGEVGIIEGAFGEAFLNAVIWGNQNTLGKKVKVTEAYGSLGGVVYVEDEGNGFDYESQIEKLRRGEPHDFSFNGGCGMRNFNDSNLHVAYHNGGSKISIATKAFTKEELRSLFRS